MTAGPSTRRHVTLARRAHHLPARRVSAVSAAQAVSAVSAVMADIQLRDEDVRDRIRAAEEFLDPSTPAENERLLLRLTCARRCASAKVRGGCSCELFD